jgi:hypothetical protein
MEQYETFDLINYFDVWGNENDGWVINNQCVECNDLKIDRNWDDKLILEFLKSIGFLSTSDLRSFVIDSSEDTIEIYKRKGMMPLCALIPNQFTIF